MSALRNLKVKRYGWIPDLPDHRDLLYSAPIVAVRQPPPRVDLTPRMPAVYDQGDLGSCTANAVGAAFQFARRAQRKPSFVPSRLFVYYNERAVEGTIGEDSGAQLRTGIKVVAKLGVCTEKSRPGTPHDWPYLIEEFAVRPPGPCFRFATDYQALVYRRVPRSLTQLKGCLAAGSPFVFGFTVFDSFESAAVARTGVVPMPAKHERVVGGHAVLAVGYDDASARFIVRNSWGAGWGKKGYCSFPYSYLTDDGLSDDFWTIRLTE